MISEAIKSIQKMVQDGNTTTMFTVPSEPKDVYFLDNHDGNPVRHLAEPAPRRYRATSLTGLCQQIKYFHSFVNEKFSICVFVGRSRVVVLMDEDSRRESIVLTLADTQGFSWLSQAQSTPKNISQKSLIWELRSRFASQVSPANFLPDLRQLRFKSGDEGESTVGVGNGTLRRSVQAGVMMGDGKQLAEKIGIYASVYEGVPEIAGSIEFDVSIDVDLSKQEIIVKTNPGECESAILATHESIAAFINERCLGVTVFVDSSPE